VTEHFDRAPTQVTFIDHTADVGVRITAATAAEAFIAAAEAMFDVMIDRMSVSHLTVWPIEVDAAGWEDLLIAWLEELLWRHESEGMMLHSCLIGHISPTHLRAVVEGEVYDRDRHERRTQVKAVTYHQLRAAETERGFEIQAIFDI
jgi:SHS2 domain-containing protein